jgi:hypothetical protein
MTDSYEEAKHKMELVLATLKIEKRKMTTAELENNTRLDKKEVETALDMLLIRKLIRCDSFNPSKRGGQAGVRVWGGSPFTALWEAIEQESDESR